MVGLDLKDRKILYELDIDARQSLSQIGKKVGLSKEVVNYRISRLTQEGVIKGFYARIDASRCGFTTFRNFLRFQNLSPEKEKELTDYIVSRPQIGWCVSVQGNWDLNFIYWAKDSNEFFGFWKEFKKKYGEHISNSATDMFGWFRNFPKGFLLGKKPDEFRPFQSGLHEKAELDKKDMKILSILSKKARTPIVEIAEKTGLGTKAVSERIKKMEKEGTIGGYGVQLDLAKIGYEYWKVHVKFKSYTEKRFNELNEYCAQHPNVVYTDELIGGPDFEIELHMKNYAELQEFLKDVRYKFGDLIRDFEVILYYNEHKLVLFPWEE